MNALKTYSDQHAELTQRVTFQLAAGIVGNADFPSENLLPDSIPQPFTNFGHQPLIDHTLLRKILWSTIRKMQMALKPWKNIHYVLLWLNVAVSVGVAVAIASRSAELIWPGVIAGFAVLGTLGSLIGRRTKKYRKEIAEIKAQCLERLLSFKWDDEASTGDLPNREKHFGTGNLDSKDIPVLTVIRAEDPFPGFGRLQADMTFVCRPAKNREIARHMVNETITANARRTVEESSVGAISSGRVMVVNGESVGIQSKWLDREKTPILWIPALKGDEYVAGCEETSCREYFAIQAIFPQHLTALTFFVRTFMAGNAASCHLALSTIGPPIFDLVHLRRVLLSHKICKEEDNAGTRPNTQVPVLKSTKKQTRWNALTYLKSATRGSITFLSPLLDLSTILEMAPDGDELSEKEAQDFKGEFNKIIEQSTQWPGCIGFSNINFRDHYSYTFPSDFFAKPEMLACVRTMYDQVSRSIIDSLEELGYDVSAYKDKEGNYSIRADKIDNIVLGEKIYMEKVEKKDSAKPAAEPVKQGA
jgi:hypothetical protein